jgi:superfamily I DNA/RNA helicase
LHPLLAHLNPEQRAAVEATEGPLLILAGAGSGKTRVITHRIAWLIREKNVAPDSILAVTFTNKAAGEMAERVDQLLGHTSLAKPLISTFHSFCVRILRRDIETLKVAGQGLTRAFTIFDETDQQGIVKQVMKRMGLDTKQMTPRSVQGRISWAKNHMVDPQDYFLSSKDPTGERVAHIFQAYQAELRKNNALDFDDLLLEAVRLLKASGEVRERYQRRYQYLLVDEYQDTNRPQYELMKLLAGEHKNVCAVGDEDQSIYSWRGADIRNILEFEKDFPNARIVRLEQNYRSTQTILEAAGAVVANNIRRKGKKLWTDRQGGSLIGYYEAPDGENEALFIADKIQTFLGTTAETQDAGGQHCAVLYRINSQSRLIEEALRRYNISYTMVGGFSFYERAEIKDLLAYLRLVKNPHDSMALQRVINTPARGIGKTTLETVERLALETGVSTWDAVAAAIANRLISTRALMALESFRQLILDAQAMMDPDFAGKLAADVAESHASDSDTDFAFGARSPASPNSSENGAQAQEDASLSRGESAESPQTPLLDASHFSQFIEAPKRPFLEVRKQDVRPYQPEWPAEIVSAPKKTVEISFEGKTCQISEEAYRKLEDRLEALEERAARISASGPRTDFISREPLKVAISFDPLRISGWEEIGVIHNVKGKPKVEQFGEEAIPEKYQRDPENCEHCNTRRRRNNTYILKHENGSLQQVGSKCIHEFLGDKPEVWKFDKPEVWRFRSVAIQELAGYLDELVRQDLEAPPVVQPAWFDRVGSAGPQDLLPSEETTSAFRSPGDAATLPELIRFLIDRTGYIKALEAEGSPEAFSRIENLKELANAAHDAEERGETLAEFLDHAALASDTDQFDPNARVTLMTLHSAKGLEFPLVFLAGMEDGLFPHSRTLNDPQGDLEEERRLCYVGMTRAMNTLILTRAHYRRRYGADVPEASIPSRFLEEVPEQLIENLGGRSPAWSTPAYTPGHSSGRRHSRAYGSDAAHFNYEDESQEIPHATAPGPSSRREANSKSKGAGAPESLDNIARFFGGRPGATRRVPQVPTLRPGRDARPRMEIPESNGAFGLRKGQRVFHTKYGEGTVLQREGDGEDAKLTVLFARHGIKKLVEKFANLKKV